MEIRQLLDRIKTLQYQSMEIQKEIGSCEQEIDLELLDYLVENGILNGVTRGILEKRDISTYEAVNRAIALYLYCLENGSPVFEQPNARECDERYLPYPGEI